MNQPRSSTVRTGPDTYRIKPGIMTTIRASVDAATRPELKDERHVLDTLCGPMGRVIGR